MTFHPGAFVRLVSQQKGAGTFQVVSCDDLSGNCWIRRWPLTRQGSPTFAVSLEQLASQDLHVA